MIKKQFEKRIFACLFLVLLLIPCLGMLVLGPSGAAAKEILAPAPRLLTAEGRFNAAVLNETADYLADHFALRRQMLTAWSALQSLLNSSPEEQVIRGRDGWLYFSETLEDYAGARLSDGELEQIARRLSELSREAEARGGRFLFTVAPNKNSLYPEYMPERFPRGHENSDLVRLLPLLEQYGVAYVDLFSPDIPYYRTDTHWTAEGAALAADRILSALGRGSDFSARNFRAEGLHKGDLYEMLYPALAGNEPEIVPDFAFSFVHENEPRGGEALKIRTHCKAGQGRLFCWRDSFGIALYPYLAESFETALFTRSSDFSLPEEDSDLYLLEIVERNLGDLIPDT